MLHRYTLKRIDPWSVLKFGALVSVVVFLLLTLTVAFVWFILTSFDLVNRGCDVALDVGFSSCDITAGVVFRATALVAGLIAVVHTAVLVFGAFLFNLIAELTGGIGVTLAHDGAADADAAQQKAPTQAKPAAPVTTTPPKTQSNAPVTPPASRPAPPVNPQSTRQRDELFD
jgi:hypothetical protein